MDIDLSSSSDDPIPWELLQRFSCLNTNDRDVLIQQFKVLLGEKCTESDAEFWLDMNNWNLQAAVCAYFDNESTSPNFLMMMKLPSIQIVPAAANSTNEYLPNSSFTYSCTVTNSGDEQWPAGCSLRLWAGEKMTTEDRYLMPRLQPGESWELILYMTSPEKSGMYFSHWRPATITGQFFGADLYIFVSVLDDLNQVTEQLSATSLCQQQQQQQLCSTGVMVTENQSPIVTPFCKLSPNTDGRNCTVTEFNHHDTEPADDMEPIVDDVHNHRAAVIIHQQAQQHDDYNFNKNDAASKNGADNINADTDVPLQATVASSTNVLDDNSMS